MPTMITTRKAKVDSAPGVKKYKGICSTCNNAPTCMYLKTRKPPVSQCEEFDNHSTERPKAAQYGSSETAPLIASTDQDREAVMYKGLCVNCENRKTCKLTKREGGIWHCEEYQ